MPSGPLLTAGASTEEARKVRATVGALHDKKAIIFQDADRQVCLHLEDAFLVGLLNIPGLER